MHSVLDYWFHSVKCIVKNHQILFSEALIGMAYRHLPLLKTFKNYDRLFILLFPATILTVHTSI